MRKAAAVLIMLTMFAAPVAQTAVSLPPAFESAWARLASDHGDALESEGIVGGTFAFVHDGRIAAVEYHGMEDVASRRPVDEETIYHWASITKTLTGVAVMQLYEQGLVGLDDPVVRHVPELRSVHDPYDAIEKVSIRHLLSHTAGFRASTWPWGGDEPWHPFEPTQWPQLVAMLPYTRLHFEPGSRYAYSNPGFIFLARILEKITGDEYESHIDKNIFDALGMHSSYFDRTPWHLRDARSNSYRVLDGKPVANGLDFDTGITVANGGLNAPVDDIARWLSFLMDGGAGDNRTAPAILGREFLEKMWVPVASAEPDSLGENAIGLSFFVRELGGHRLVGHTGSQRSFVSFILFDPDARIGIIGAYNTAGGDETAPDLGKVFAVRKQAVDNLFPLFGEQTE